MSSKSRALDLSFRDRRDAGAALGKVLLKHRDWQDPVVLALTRGGVAIAAEVARELDAPLDVLLVHKIGHPRRQDFAIGALASGGVAVVHAETEGFPGTVSSAEMDRLLAHERAELERREALYRGGLPAVPVHDRAVILVDDGVDTGGTMRAAVQAVRQLAPAHVTVAVPVGARESCDALRSIADDVVCVRTPEPFQAVARWYSEFPQVSDDEVRSLLATTRRQVES